MTGTVASTAPLAQQTPVPTAARATGPAPAEDPGQAPARRETVQDADPAQARRGTAWNHRSTSLTAAMVVLLVAAVVSLPAWSPGAVAESSATAQFAGAPTAVPSEPSTGIVAETTRSTQPQPTSTTSTQATPDDSAAGDSYGLIWYSDLGHSFTMAVPASWTEVSRSEMADHESNLYHLVGFADTSGPALAGVYLNCIDVDVRMDPNLDESSLPTLAKNVQQGLDAAVVRYDYCQVLEPIREVMVGDFPGYSVTARVTWQERVIVQATYVCLVGQRVYRLSLQTDDADWATYEALFADIVRTFAFGSEETGI